MSYFYGFLGYQPSRAVLSYPAGSAERSLISNNGSGIGSSSGLPLSRYLPVANGSALITPKALQRSW
jgi:hypothetical protein